MGSSFVGIGKNGFWLRDGFLELWLRLLALHIKDPAKDDPNAPVIRAIRDQWLLASRGVFNGCVPVGLDDAVRTKAGEKAVREAAASLLRALEAAPERLSKDVLNLLGFENRLENDDETWRLISIGRAFLDVLDGKEPPKDPLKK
ncbi:MAG: hypothetical protein KGJ84_13110 [Elusimicrobia bacterium]|nr:hypothetical protein [Elusimicrobiota bacterium]